MRRPFGMPLAVLASILVAVLAIGIVAVLLTSDKDQDERPTGSAKTTSPEARNMSTDGNSSGEGVHGNIQAERDSATVVEKVYTGLNGALEAGVVPLEANVRQSLARAQKSEGLKHVCESMTAAARRQTVVYAQSVSKLGGVGWTCEKGVALLIRRARMRGVVKEIAGARVIDVNVSGNRATATVQFGGGRISTVSLVRDGEDWKLMAAPAGG